MIAALARRLGIVHSSQASRPAQAQAQQLPVTVHVGRRRLPVARTSVEDADAGQLPKQPKREPAEHAALVALLRQEFGLKHGLQVPPADPPASSTSWPVDLLRRWFKDGGNLTTEALNAQPASAEMRRLIDMVGCGLPVAELDPVRMGQGGLLGAIRRGDAAGLAALVAHLAENDCVTCDLGMTSSTLRALTDEGALAWPAMIPGQLRAPDGGTVSGRSPSNAPRGDRFVLYRSLDGGENAWPALTEADAALGAVRTPLSMSLYLVTHLTVI